MKTIYKYTDSMVRVYVTWMAVVSLCLGCTEQKELLSSADGREKGVTLTIPVAAAAMEGSVADTRAEEAKVAAEKTIKTLYLLQFDGTNAAAKLLQCAKVYDNATGMQGGTVTLQFKPATQTTQGIYLVANTTPAVTVNSTTKSDFEAMLALYAPTKGSTPALAIPAGGLPMRGYVEFDPMTVTTVPAVTLKAMVTKLNLTYNLKATGLSNYLVNPLTLRLKRVTNGTTFKEQAAGGGGGYAPVGMNRNTELIVGTMNVGELFSHCCYFPENLGGQKSGLTEKTRGLANSPVGAMSLELTGKLKDNRNVTFVYFPGAEGNQNDFNVVRNHVYNVTIDIKGIFADDERIMTGNFKNLSVDANGNSATANCYIVPAYTTCVIDATKRGNGYESTTDPNVSGIKYGTLPDLTKAKSAGVIWETTGKGNVITSAKLSNGKVIFTTGTGQYNGYGNGLIGIFDGENATGNCLWSWHIWMNPDVSSKDVECKGATTFKMQGFNLGSYNNIENAPLSIGLLYQWGRKDPFPSPQIWVGVAESTSIFGSFPGGISWNGNYTLPTAVSNVTNGTEVWAVQHPATFIQSSSVYPSEWYYADVAQQNNCLWGNTKNTTHGKKSIYDPCPIGYRVPPQQVQPVNPSFVSTTNGMRIKGMGTTDIWFPIQNLRGVNGTLGPNGTANTGTGYYWNTYSNASIGGATNYGAGCYWRLDRAGVSIGHHNKADAFSIRCVSESISD